MTIEIKVPVLPESVADATVVTWYKKPGDLVKRGENIVDLETEKVVLEVPAAQDGVIKEILKAEGETVESNQVLALLDDVPDEGPVVAKPGVEEKSEAAPASPEVSQDSVPAGATTEDLSPSVRRLIQEHNVDVSNITGTGKGGRIIKEDVMKVVEAKIAAPKTAPEAAPVASAPKAPSAPSTSTIPMGEREEKRVPMTRIRVAIADRLLSAQQNAAILTTFNEINLYEVMDLRKTYKEEFEKKHGVKLGFMSFFTKAAIEALKRFPTVNASIDGKDVIYHGYFDIGIAVSTERGLVVPILRDADQMSMADIELSIKDYATRAQAGKLSMEEMTGGTFTITNGGVFGSLLSTPILNPPQSAILGMHKIEQRAVVEDGELVIRPMMYVAMSYDHRIIDGKDSVQFLVTIKRLLEDPTRLLLDV